MHIARVVLSGKIISHSKPHCTPKPSKENAEDYEARTWQNRLHYDDEGVYIPAMMLKNTIAAAAKFLSISIPGKGKSTYTKHFEAGVLVTDQIPLFSSINSERILPPTEEGLIMAKAMRSEIDSEEAQKLEGYERQPNEVFADWIFTPSDGTPGGGRRVWKCYPMISHWTGECDILVLDDTITKDVFGSVLIQAGQLIGMGRHRVRNRGTYGQFTVDSFEWADYSVNVA